jgi:hypothetical protein
MPTYIPDSGDRTGGGRSSRSYQKPLPPGDYDAFVTAFEQKISQGARTSGSTMYVVSLKIRRESDQCPISLKIPLPRTDPVVVKDYLVDHEVCRWKLNDFMKAAAVELAPGEGYSFDPEQAERDGCRFINPIGLKVRVTLGIETATRRDGSTYETNKVQRYLFGTLLNPRVASPAPPQRDFRLPGHTNATPPVKSAPGGAQSVPSASAAPSAKPGVESDGAGISPMPVDDSDDVPF